jgi:hypothetical protein
MRRDVRRDAQRVVAADAVVAADGAFDLVDAAEGDGFPLPAVKAKDAVGFRDHLPALQVTHLATALLPLTHLGAIQRCSQGSDLFSGEDGIGHGDESGEWKSNELSWARC